MIMYISRLMSIVALDSDSRHVMLLLYNHYLLEVVF